MSESSNPAPPGGIPWQSGPDGLPRRFGKYTLLRKLAVGGMAELFLALHRSVASFEKLVVIKRILPSMNNDQAFIDMLLHEARIAATLSHPNIVQIFDVGYVDGSYYIAMEHIHGEDLRSIVRQMKKLGVPEFPITHALGIIIGTCSALAYAHDRRGLDGTALHIVHRDISPQNIVVTYTGDVKVVDFGIAKSGLQVGEETSSGRLKGKLPYMSPEQAKGEDIDWRSDIFAVGVLLFELTTGRRLFKGSNELETLKMICEREYPRPSRVRQGYSPQLEQIVLKALAKDRSERYQSAREMQSDLEAYVREEKIPVSEVDLCRWMERLFSERLAQHKEALQDVKQLADLIAQQVELDLAGSGFDDLISQSGRTSARATLTSSSSTIGIKGVPKRPLTGYVVLAAALAASIGVGSYLLLKRPHTPEAALASSALVPGGAPARVAVTNGIVKIESTPAGASIWINGELRAEKTPTTIERLPIGADIGVKVTMDGYAAAKQDVRLSASHNSELLQFVLVAGTVTVSVTTNVPNPAITVDGKPASGSKIEQLSAGEEHKIMVSADGFVGKTMTVSAGPNEARSLNVVLEKDHGAAKKAGDKVTEEPAREASKGGSGKLNVGSHGGYCAVSVDGQPHGSTPVGGISLPAGIHRVSCQSEGGKTLSQSVKVEADQTARVSFSLD